MILTILKMLYRKINTHNKSLLRKRTPTPEKLCNCWSKPNCLLNGKCLTTNIIYQATVKCENNKETYIGLTGDQFKSRYRNHTASFSNTRKRSATELSKHIWTLKDSGKDFTLSWKIITCANPYSNTSKQCNLCSTEKYFIICRPSLRSLNKRNELTSTCRYVNKFLLKYA